MANLFRVHLGSLNYNDGHERDHKESEQMGHEIVVTQFDVLEVNALQEVRQPPAMVDLKKSTVCGGGGWIGTHGG